LVSRWEILNTPRKTEVIDEVLHSDFVCHEPNSETGEIRGIQNGLTGKVACRRLTSPHVGVRLSGPLAGPYRHTYDTG
jgi:hypothetical protein